MIIPWYLIHSNNKKVLFLNVCSTHSPAILGPGPGPSGSLPLLTSWCLQTGAWNFGALLASDKMESKNPWLAKASHYHSSSSTASRIQFSQLQSFWLKPTRASCSRALCMVSTSSLPHLEWLSHRSIPAYILHMLQSASKVTKVSPGAVDLCSWGHTLKILTVFMFASASSFCQVPGVSIIPDAYTHICTYVYVRGCQKNVYTF